MIDAPHKESLNIIVKKTKIEDDNKSAAAGLVKYTQAEFPENVNSRVPQILNQILTMSVKPDKTIRQFQLLQDLF